MIPYKACMYVCVCAYVCMYVCMYVYKLYLYIINVFIYIYVYCILCIFVVISRSRGPKRLSREDLPLHRLQRHLLSLLRPLHGHPPGARAGLPLSSGRHAG